MYNSVLFQFPFLPGALVTSRASFIVLKDTWEISTNIPIRFISCTTSCRHINSQPSLYSDSFILNLSLRRAFFTPLRLPSYVCGGVLVILCHNSIPSLKFDCCYKKLIQNSLHPPLPGRFLNKISLAVLGLNN